MSIDHLRTGWPEGLLTGQYRVVRSRLHDVGEMFKQGLLLDLPDPAEPVLEVRVDGRTLYHFVRGSYLITAGAPHQLVLQLRARDQPAWRWPWWLFPLRVLRWLFGDQVHDVVDNRLGVVVGTVVRRWGVGIVLMPQRLHVLDPAGRPIGRLAESITLTGRLPWGGRRFSVLGDDGVRAARVRQAGRLLGHSVKVEVEPGSTVDPRLILACILRLDA